MLSVAKLRVGQEAYQLSGVAQSLDDYYTGAGEAAGRWLGVGAERLGLAGDVSPDDLRAVLAGMAPGSGGLNPNGETIRPHPRRVPGFDLTFKTPKSVSVLYAVSDDPRVQGEIIDAGASAVREALGWLEREAVHIRRGTGNEAFLNDLAARDPDAAAAARIRTLPGRGVVAAAFRHRTSRAGDPLLHWHTLVANMVEGPDGRWSAFVHPDLYRAARAAGEVFQSVLRAELTARLGIEWRPSRHVPEVAGVPQAMCDLFSKRSVEIEDWLIATGTPNDPAGRQQAVLATRRGKPEVEHDRFDSAWKAEATAAGWGPDAADALLAASGGGRVPDVDEMWRLPEQVDGSGESVVADRVANPEAWVVQQLCRELTESDSTFTRPQVVQTVAASVGQGATMATLERMVASVMASPEVVPVGDDGDRWTTAELLAVERRFLDTAGNARLARSPVPDVVIEQVIAQFPTLGTDQAAAVRAITGSGDGVSVLVGPAGTGKTYTLETIRAVYEAAGYRVQGAAPSARAAHELHAGANISSSTIHRLLGSRSRGFDRPDDRTVLVVDEAAMTGIRNLEATVTGTVAAGGRVVLVGDHHQLPEVTAGGGFAALATGSTGSPVTVAELTVNRRQHHPWEQRALCELRDGHVARAVAAYREHDRVVVTEGRPAMLTTAVDRWLDAQGAGLSPVLLAGTNDTVDALNRAVRRALDERGHLGESVGAWAGRGLAVGERVVLRLNDYTATTTAGERASVLNGQTATVVCGNQGGVVVCLDHDGRETALGSAYLSAGGVDYGYALTSHRAQGGTWDLAISVGADGLYREAAYLVLSRGRQENWLVLTQPEVDVLDADLARHDSVIPLPGEELGDLDEELNKRLDTSRAKFLALTRDPQSALIAAAADADDLATLEARAAYARSVERRATVIGGIDLRSAKLLAERIEHTATHVAVGQRVKALDRNNLGTIVRLDDTDGQVRVEFVAADGHIAERDLGWDQVQIVDRRTLDARRLTADAQAALDRLVEPVRRRVERWHQVLADQRVDPVDRHVHEGAARLVVERAAAELAATSPAWLTGLVGARPTRPDAAQVWDDTVAHIAAYRSRHSITDPTCPFGPTPADPERVAAWDRGQTVVAQAQVWLDTYVTGPALAVARTRSHTELMDRRRKLDDIFELAPADHRSLINRLRAGDQLPLDGVADLITEALAAQGERRRWILEHWPHVVEYSQIVGAIDAGLVGPDISAVLGNLTTADNRVLSFTAEERAPWLVSLAAQLMPADGETPNEQVFQLFGDVADYRRRWDVSHPAPLGVAAIDPEQAVERSVLMIAIDHARRLAEPQQTPDVDGIDRHPLSFAGCSDDLGW